MAWLFLLIAIITEVSATLCLKLAAEGKTKLYFAVAAGYLASFSALSLALQEGMALGVAYGIWSAVGVALTALLSRLLFREPLTGLMVAGIGLIMAGVLLVEIGAGH